MAEFALGLTKTAVAGTVSRVKSAMEEESKRRERVQEDLVFITGEFEMMQSFLSASNAGDRASKNLVVRTWVRQLRDLAFDVEDCVEFIIHLDGKSSWTWLWRVVPSCMARSLPLDQAVAEIKRLKARVEDVSQRNTRYNLMGGGDGTSADDGGHPQLPSSSTGSSSKGPPGAGPVEVLLDVWKASGKLRGIIDLEKLIVSEVTQLQVISLWRPIGAAANVGNHAAPPPNTYALMMKKVYDSPEICRRFKNNRAWVKLSALGHPFNPVEFVTNLLTQFTSHCRQLKDHDHHANANSSTISELLLQLSQLTYLVVIEQELTSVADWDAIRFFLRDGNNGSRILLSTNTLGIALVCTGKPYQVSELKHSSHDGGIYAFYPKGSGHRIGMGDFFWQLRHPGVISVFDGSTSDNELSNVMCKIFDDSGDTLLRVLDGVEFEYCHSYEARTGQFDLAEFVGEVLQVADPAESNNNNNNPRGEEWRCGPVEMGRCRQFLAEHDCLIYIGMGRQCLTDDWDLLKRDLLSSDSSSRSCIVVMTDEESVSTHYADDESRALHYQDLLSGSDQGGGNPKQDVDYFTYELGNLVGREYDCNHHVDGCSLYMPGSMTSSVWGIAGIGKSALVREEYFSLKKESGNRNIMFGWVDVPHPFNLRDFCRRLLLDFFSNDVEAKEAAAISMVEGHDPTQWCSKIMRTNKFYLVVDGLQSKQDWDLIKAALLSGPIIGHTVVVTREESIAKHCLRGSNEDHIRNLQGLGDGDAVHLFTKTGLNSKEMTDLRPEIRMALEGMVSKFGGIPQIIIAMAKISLLESQNIDYFLGMTSHFIRRLEAIDSLRGLFCWMQSYFDACPDELKPCIFYLTVFDADQGIRWSRLLRRWIAEGYTSGVGGTAEEKGRKLLSQLMKLCIVYPEQETTSTKTRLKVNDFFREYIKSRPMEDNLVFALEGSCSPSSRLAGQHLTISSSWDRDEVVFNNLDLSRLRSVTVFGAWKHFLISDKMKLLRVLDLEGTTTSDVTTSVTDKDLEKILKLLSRIKFISLRGCVHITRLPDSLGDMVQLETLDAKNTSIAELPLAIITKLHKLQYIRAGTSMNTSLFVPLQTKTSKPPSPSPPQEDSHGGTSPFLAGASALHEASTKIFGGCSRKARDPVESCSNRSRWWQSKKHRDLCMRRRVATNGGGVVVVHVAAVEGIGSLTHLHTLGTVNVAGGKCAFLFLKELKKLTQLRKLRLSGINRKNWRHVCDAISGNLHHLESLSLQLMLLEGDVTCNYQFACFDQIAEPPNTLKCLKVLYTSTGVRAADAATISQGWLKKLNFPRFVHELTITSQEDIGIIEKGVAGSTLHIKPTEEHLSFEKQAQGDMDCLRIECNNTLSHSKVTFGDLHDFRVGAISIHCCCSSSAAGTSARSSSSCNLQISGLNMVRGLSIITVTGTYSDGLKRDLRKQFENNEHQPTIN
uniref:Uncharacterized protein n=1 Tax=Avena sativa TaxID=4498 RepID=A0ACD6A987_AVESA